MEHNLTVYYSHDDPSAFDTSLTFFEDLRKQYGARGAVDHILQHGGVFNTTDDTAWIAMSFGIRARGIDRRKMQLFAWDGTRWALCPFDAVGDLIHPLPFRDDLRAQLLFVGGLMEGQDAN